MFHGLGLGKRQLKSILCLATIVLLIFSIFTIPIPITFSQESDPSSGDQGSSEGTTSGDANNSDASQEGESNDESGSDPADSDSDDESEESSSDDQPEEPSSSDNQTGGSEGPADSDPSSESNNSGNQTSDEPSADQPESSEEPSSAGNQTSTEPVDSGSSSSRNESGETEVYVELEEDGSGIAQLEDDIAKVDFETGSIYFGDTIEEGGMLNMTVLPPEDFVASLLEEELEAMYIQEEGEEFEVNTETGADYTIEGYVYDIDFENVTLAEEEGVTLALEYDDTSLSENEEQGIRILHFNHEILGWEVLQNNDENINGGEEVDTDSNIVYGTTYSFSHFVPGSGPGGPSPPTIDPPTSPNNDNTPTITGTKDPDTSVELFDFDTDASLGVAGPDAFDTWSITTSTLEDGLHTLYAVSYDAENDNSTSTGMDIVIDTTGPTTDSVIVSPDISNATTTVTATTTDSGSGGTSIAAAEYFIDIDPPGSYGTGLPLSATDGTFDEVSEDITGIIDFTGYQDGIHTVYAHAKDENDNWGPTAPVTFTLDTTSPPAPVITYPLTDDIFDYSPDIEGTVATNFLAQWGTFGTGESEFDGPYDIAVTPSGVNFVADIGNDRIQMFASDGSLILEWNGDDGEPFVSPVSIAIDSDAFVYVGDNILQNIQKFDTSGGFITSWGLSGSGNGEFLGPMGIAAWGSDENIVIYVADVANHRIQKFDSNGNFTTKWGKNGGDGTSGSGDGEFNSPYGIAVDADGNVYIADTGNDRIQKFDSDGNFITKWGSSGFNEGEFSFPRGVAVNIVGDVYVVDELNNRIQKFDSDGSFLTSWGEYGTQEGQFDSPHKMAFDSLGNAYVVDHYNNRIQKFEADSRDPVIEIFDDGTTLGTLSPTLLTGFWFITPDPELGDGTYNVTARVTDAAGNESPDSNSITFTVDTGTIEETGTVSGHKFIDIDNDGFHDETEEILEGVVIQVSSTEYSVIDSGEEGGPAYDFIDISGTGTEILPSVDDEAEQVAIGFEFNYYGLPYNTAQISSNGIISFDEPIFEYINVPLGDTSYRNFISAYWDDLVTRDDTGAGTVYYQTMGSEPNRIFIVQWNDTQHYYSSSTGITFEAILFENSSQILFQYQNLEFGTVSDSLDPETEYDNGLSATVGLEGPADALFTQYSHNEGVLEPGLVIMYEPDTTVYGSATTDVDGFYSIPEMPAGIGILIQEVVPTGYIPTTPEDGFTFKSLVADENLEVDFGNLPTGMISGYKFNDEDNDGVWDEGEDGLLNVEICVFSSVTSSEYCTTTGEDGSFTIEVPVGQVTIYETIPDRYLQTAPQDFVDEETGVSAENGEYSLMLGQDEVFDRALFGNHLILGDISGNKFVDEDEDSIWDENEEGLYGVEIDVIGPGYARYTDSNDEGGPVYDFIDISGDEGATAILLDDNFGGSTEIVPIGFTFNYYGLDHTEVLIATDGYVYFEALSTTNLGSIALLSDNLATFDDAAVYYETIGDEPNRMLVVEWKDVQHYPSSESGATFELILFEGSNEILFQYDDVSFGIIGDDEEAGTWADNGANAFVGTTGIADISMLTYSSYEPALNASLAILFVPGDTIIAQTVTEEDGSYLISTLPVGAELTISEVVPSGYTPTTPEDGSIALVLTEEETEIDFGNQLLTEATIFGTKFEDQNNNGAQDLGEGGLEGVQIMVSSTDYEVSESEEESFTDISGTGTQVLSDNDFGEENVEIGFDFDYYGITYDRVNIETKGVMSFVETLDDFSNEPLDTTFHHNFISAYWDDLVTYGDADAIYYETIGEPGSRQFIVQWNDVMHFDSSESTATFEAILFEGSNSISFTYQDISFGAVSGSDDPETEYDNGASATIGLAGPEGFNLEYSFNGAAVQDGLTLLFSPSTIVYGTDVTDEEGSYSILGVPFGNVIVSEVVPDGYIPTEPQGGVTSVALDSDAEIDFGNVHTGNVSGVKFLDIDADGVQDEDEVGLADIEICVENNDSDFSECTFTDEDGSFTVENVPAGDITIFEETPENYNQTAPQDFTDEGEAAEGGVYYVTLAGGEIFDGALFGNHLLSGTINGYKFVDADSDGVWDEGEEILEGVTINVYGSGYDISDSNEEGGPAYDFIDISDDEGATEILSDEGGFEVQEQVPIGFSFDLSGTSYETVDVATVGMIFLGDDGVISPFSDDLITSDSEGAGAVYYETIGEPGSRQFIVQWNDVFYNPSSPSGVTFEAVLCECNNEIKFQYADVDFGDVEHDDGATAGVSVSTLLLEFEYSHNEAILSNGLAVLFSPNDNSPIGSAITDEEGFYEITGLPAGQALAVSEDVPPGYAPTTPEGGSVDIVLTEAETEIDFGNQPTGGSDETGSISGYKFEDIDGDGEWDEDELPIAGVEICAENEFGFIECTETAEDGSFTIEDVPVGDVEIYEQVPEGYEQSAPEDFVDEDSGESAEDGSYLISLEIDEVFEDAFFGNHEIVRPEVSLIDVSDAFVTGADESNTFTVTITFSEPMNESITPALQFSPDISTTLSLIDTEFTSSTQFVASYEISDDDIEESGVDISVSGAEDLSGNVQDPDPDLIEDVFDIDTAAPTVPSLLIPADAATIDDDTPTFDWTESTDASAVTYALEVDDNMPFTSPEIVEVGLEESSFTTLTALEEGSYFWRVTATDAVGNSNGTLANVFTIDLDTTGPSVELSAIVPFVSNQGRELMATAIDEDNNVVAAEFFIDSVGADGTGSSMDASDGSFDELEEDIEGVIDISELSEGTHTVSVHAQDAAGNWGPVDSQEFVVDTIVPSSPILVGPADGAVTAVSTPALDWIAPTDATAIVYHVLIDNDSDFSSPEFEGEDLDWSLPHSLTTPLLDGTYYWKVSADDEALNTSPFSSVFTFTIDTVGPVTVEPIIDLGGPVDFVLEDGELESIEAIAESKLPVESKPAGVDFPFGFFAWTITGLSPGGSVTMTITYPSNVEAGSTYWKIVDGEWVDASEILGSNDGDETITLTITDGSEFDDDGEVNGEISDPGGVGEGDDPPVADAGSDQTVDEGEVVLLDGTGSSDEETDGEDLEYSWVQVSGPAVTLNSPTNSSTTFTAPLDTDTVLVFELTVNDDVQDSEPDSVSITVHGRGDITITKVELDTENLLPGSAFTITPDPFTLSGSLVVEDNDDNDSDPTDGIIEVNNVRFSSYTLEETTTPEGFARLVTSITIAIHNGNPTSDVTVENRGEDQEIEETEEVPPPQLDEEQIEEFEDHGATVEGEAVDSADDLPPALIGPPEDADELDPVDVIFTEEADSDATGPDLFTDFGIPTYPAPDESIANRVFYAPPIFVIPAADGSIFALTPIIDKIFEQMTLLVVPPEETEVTSASIQSVEIEFGEGGNDVGFSFELSADIPEDLPDLDDTDETALFLDVDFVGDIDFSDPDAFASPPEFVILVSKSLDGPKLEDGCPDIRLYLLNEVTDEWEVVETPERNPVSDTTSECSYIIHTEHFSKFAIGSVKGSISNVNSRGASIGDSSRTVLVPTTFSNEYFEINPLMRVSVAETTFLTVNGQPSSAFSVGETVQISSTISNHQRESQHYVFIVQILDKDGITQSVSWSSGLLEKAQEYTASQSWTTKEAGNYEVRVYIWNEWEMPVPLSNVEVSNLQVSWTGPTESA